MRLSIAFTALTDFPGRRSVQPMFDQGDILESALRGAAAGISILLAVVLVAGGAGRTRRLAALFTLSIGVYVFIAGKATQSLLGPLMLPAIIISILGTVFFWWFAASLFDDNFRWRWWRIAPLFILPGNYLFREVIGDTPLSSSLLYMHLTLNGLFFADSLRLALMNAADDLVDPRRYFRFAIATVVAIFGIGIAAAEIIERDHILPDGIRLFHATAIFALNLFFGAWLLLARNVLLAEAPPAEALAPLATPAPASPTLRAADRPIFEKLIALMEEGAYRREGLSVAQMAGDVGTPEHVLRRLINQELGYRNFSSFLNRWRIAEAKKALSDPERARDQVLQIALHVGYGSIAPFNRAFKQATGQTPTEFRKNALDNL